MIVGHSVVGKGKSLDLVSRFIAGAKGRMAKRADVYEGGDVAFYGITENLIDVWRKAKAKGANWWAIDNAYIDKCREHYFRVTMNRMQHPGTGAGSPSRLAKIGGVDIKPWRTDGSFILVCPQSDKFMQLHAGITNWTVGIIELLRMYTDRPIQVQGWQRDKARFYEALPAVLKGAHAVVTWSSAAAHTATFLGVPAFVTGEDAIARRWLNDDVSKIETPDREVDREAFAAMLAKWQFNRDELSNGTAYRTVLEELEIAA